MRLGLTGRILLAGGIVVAVLLVRFVLLVHAFHSVTEATDAEERAETSVLAASRVEKLVVDLETGARGYVITHDPAFLEPWRSARRELPTQSRELLAAAPGQQSRRIDAAWRSYLNDWSVPLVSRPVDDARARIATGEGKRRVDQIRALIDPFIASQTQVAEAQEARVKRAEHKGERVSAAGIAITIVIFALMVAYVLRRAVMPLRRVVAAHARIAEGERNVEVPEGGAGEVGTLAAGFNDMSRSLSATR